jgi:hypothetical protein
MGEDFGKSVKRILSILINSIERTNYIYANFVFAIKKGMQVG